MKNSEGFLREVETSPKRETVETRSEFLERIKQLVGDEIEKTMSHAKELTTDGANSLRMTVANRLREFGILSEDVQMATAEVGGLGSEVVIEVSQNASTDLTKKTVSGIDDYASPYRLALLGMVLSGCGEKPADYRQQTYYRPLGIAVSGDTELKQKLPGPETETAKVVSPDCGPAKPEHAPTECGVQQWRGFSETNPAAVSWMALANTGTEACRVTITRLELSYLPKPVEGHESKRILLSSQLNGIQVLSDGTDGKQWGAYLDNLPKGVVFNIPPNTHAYVHPFGPMMQVPEGAGELTVTFAAEMTEGCVVSGGLDTYQEYAIPTTEPPYTQTGATTDFIKEAMKTPWVTKTVDPHEPVSYSIQRKPRSERTGWSID